MSKVTTPKHPGATLRDEMLPNLGLNVTEAADQLGVARQSLSRVVNERAAVSPEMAIKLEQWLIQQKGPSADKWVSDQAEYDLWQARLKFKKIIKPVKAKGKSDE